MPAAIDACRAGALQRRLNCGFAKLMGRQIGECPVKRADGGTGGANNDDIVFHPKLLLGSATGLGAVWRCHILGSPGSPVNNGKLEVTNDNWPLFDLSQGFLHCALSLAAPR